MKKLKGKLNNEKGIVLIVLFAMFANCNLFAVDVAPRISDKEIVQNLSDIKSEFKVIYAKIDNNFKTLNQKIDTKIDGLKNELQAQMEGNKNELNAKFDAKFDLLIMFIGGFLLFGVSAFIGIDWSHIIVLLPLRDKVEMHKSQINKFLELAKKLAETDFKLKQLLQQCNLL